MILSAGLGTRMRPLTYSVPKPLLRVGNHRLIEYHLIRLGLAGFTNIIVNTSYLSDMIQTELGDGSKYGVEIFYSLEGDAPLETGGGIKRALPLIHSDPFLVVNADIWTDFPFAELQIPGPAVGCLVMVDNPPHNPRGDFVLHDGHLKAPGSGCASQTLTYSGIAVFRKSMFSGTSGAAFPLYDNFETAIQGQRLAGVYYEGAWYDVGTQDSLNHVDSILKNRN